MRADRQRFGEFYVAYRAEHRHPVNRALHLVAKLGIVVAVAVGVVERSVLALLAAPVLGVAPCWIGHFVFERNRPTAWTRPSASLLGALVRGRAGAGERRGRPYYSALADVRMCWDMLRTSLSRGASSSDRT